MSGYSIFLVAMMCIVAAQAAGKCTPTATDVLGPMSSYKFPSKNAVCPSTATDRITISGTVQDENCNGLGGIEINIWQTNARGAYVPSCRAKIVTDSNGKYSFTTVKPGLYSFGGNTRPSHIHFQAYSKGKKSALISQIYVGGTTSNCDAWAGQACKTAASHITVSGGKANFDIVLSKSALLAESDSLAEEAEFAVANSESVRDMIPLGEEKPTSSGSWMMVAAGVYGAVGVVSMIVGVAFFIRSRRPTEGTLYQEMVAGQEETI